MMIKKGFFDEEEENSKHGKSNKKSQKNEKGRGKQMVKTNDSDTTIYHNILEKQTPDLVYKVDPEDPEIMLKDINKNRQSTSSEDPIDTSDELIEHEISNQFIADCAAEAERRRNSGVQEGDSQNER